MASKNKKLKCFNEQDKEVDFHFVGSNDAYDGLADFEQVKDAFVSNLCSKCLERFSRQDFENNNYELWINNEQSFLNLDNYNPDNRTKLEVVFHVSRITHKVCEIKDYHVDSKYREHLEENTKQLKPLDFLKDKEYWIEERPNEFVLFVKLKGRNKTYKGSVSKIRAMMFKNNQDMKTTIVNLVISSIQLEITKDENIEKLINRQKVSEHYKEKIRRQQTEKEYEPDK